MKRTILIISFFFCSALNGVKADNAIEPNTLVEEMIKEIQVIRVKYDILLDEKTFAIKRLDYALQTAKTLEQKVELLVAKDRLLEETKKLKADSNTDISKIRYLKGLQILKILYEKILSLDHHFASVRTLNEINKIANPNQYPEYEKLKEVIAAKRDKKTAFDLTSVLGTNTIVSVVQTFTNMLNSSLTKEEKERELASVECILDFTLRMQNDLNTIYFETAFLQNSNAKMKEDIELLFKDYTKPINYSSTLESCRTGDDWETVKQKMEEYLLKVKATNGSQQYKMQVNLEFPIDRLLQFISQYNNFIDQGGKFYDKFKIILNSYENSKQCDSKLPLEYKKLKTDVDSAIEKFNIAYKPVEVNGSKMKEILYGLNEYD